MQDTASKAYKRSDKRKQSFRRLRSAWGFVKSQRFDMQLLRYFEWPLFINMLALCIFGIVAITCAVAAPTGENFTVSVIESLRLTLSSYPVLQSMWLVVGLVLIAGMLFFDYRLFADWANLLYWGIVVVLVVVLTVEAGRGGTNRWFRWGDGRTLQPAEFVKLAVIISLAKILSSREKPIQTFFDLLPVATYVGIPFILIVLQPDVGTALVCIAIFAVMLFASGTNWKLLLALIVAFLVALIPIWYYLVNIENGFRLDRILVFFNPALDPNGAGMHALNSRLAVGNGGLFGRGMFSVGTINSLRYIPDNQTDFIFAVVCETFGFVGAGVVLALMGLMIVRMIYIAANTATDAFGQLVIIGIVSMLMFHMYENIGMVIGIMPITGLPLPFFSYGGSNLIMNMAGIGLVMNIRMRSRYAQSRLQDKQTRARTAASILQQRT